MHKKWIKYEKSKNTICICNINILITRYRVVLGVIVCVLGGSVYGTADKPGVLSI